MRGTRHSLVLNNTPRVWLSHSNRTLIVPCGLKSCNGERKPRNLSGGNKNMETLVFGHQFLPFFFLGGKKKARHSMINSREWSCFLAEQERMGCGICPQPSAVPRPAFPLVFVLFFFLIPPSWINAEGLVVTQHRADSALAKCHNCLWDLGRHGAASTENRQGHSVEDGERSGSAQTPLPTASCLLPDSSCCRAGEKGGCKAGGDAALDSGCALCVGISEIWGCCSSLQVWKLDLEERFPCHGWCASKLNYPLLVSVGEWCEGRVFMGASLRGRTKPSACSELSGQHSVDGTTECNIKRKSQRFDFV